MHHFLADILFQSHFITLHHRIASVIEQLCQFHFLFEIAHFFARLFDVKDVVQAHNAIHFVQRERYN